MKVTIIAEVGVNHNGDIDLAHELIDSAAEVGADVVKFQTFRSELLSTRYAGLAEYQSRFESALFSQYEMLKKLELNYSSHESLIRHAQARGIGFLSSAFDLASIEMLDDLKVGQFKIPSGEITNLPYLRLVGSFRKPVILSSGMSDFHEIKQAINVLIDSGIDRSWITVLHCNSEYPTPMEDVNLRALREIKEKFNVDVGYSDHTSGTEVAVAAVALGATVIEKHLTKSRKLPGPDHQASLEPEEFRDMVRLIRNIERAMGDGVKRVMPSEIKNRDLVRKSLVASRPIQKGEVFTAENISAKRPGTGLSPMLWDDVCGGVAMKDYQVDEFIEI